MSEDYILGTNDAEFERLKFQHSVWGNITRNLFTRLNISKGMKCPDVGAGPGFASFDLREIIGDEGELTVLEPTEKFLKHIKLIPNNNNWENTNRFLTSNIPRIVELGIIEESESKNILTDWNNHKLNKNSLFFSPIVVDVGGRKLK